ncbi:MAG: SPOR domain-containing protein [Myxococcaceae bacterium]|nr:SPOR domain-containing protein [Myxococcaceae bacterium]
MRDINRLKEKYELSLDSRHVVGLTVGGLVLVGAVFVLGVSVGKKLAADERSLAAPDLLTALDQKAAVMADASLTFQDELTKKAPPSPPPLPPHIPEPEKIEPRVAEVPLPPVPAPAALPPAKVVEAPKVQDVIKNVAVKADEPVPTRIARDAGLKEAINRLQRTPEPSGNGSWSLQLSAYQDRAEADRFVLGLKDKGYSPYIVEAQVAGKGTWYRVRLGRFANREAAARYLTDFKRETQLEAFVTGQ